jgi:hypothetical protein
MSNYLIGPQRGTSLAGRVRSRNFTKRARTEVEDLVPHSHPRTLVTWGPHDFVGERSTFELSSPLTLSTSSADINKTPVANTAVATAIFRVPRGGYLVSAEIVGEDALAANDTNYLTFALTNKLGAGSGTTAMLAATDANTTKATGGTGITALVPLAHTVNATAANLRVADGDVLVYTATATQTPGAVDAPRVRLVFATTPTPYTPLIARTAGSPLVGPVDSVGHGEITGVLSATNEVNTAGIYCGDKRDIVATYGPIFRFRVKLGAIAANERLIIGLCDTYNATWDNVAKNAWFRFEGSLAALVETDDGTTDNDDKAYITTGTNLTLTADTYYWFVIDVTDPTAINFQIDNYPVQKRYGATLWAATDYLQPIIAVQKASGTGIPSWTADLVAGDWERV